jgi:hypothetical protein
MEMPEGEALFAGSAAKGDHLPSEQHHPAQPEKVMRQATSRQRAVRKEEAHSPAPSVTPNHFRRGEATSDFMSPNPLFTR